MKQLFTNQDRILYVTMLLEDLISSVNIGPLNFVNDSIQDMVEKMHIKLANILTFQPVVRICFDPQNFLFIIKYRPNILLQ